MSSGSTRSRMNLSGVSSQSEEAQQTFNRPKRTRSSRRVQAIEEPKGLCLLQILALLRKNILLKRRTVIATIAEILSPVLMMLVLVAAYQLSDTTYEPAEQYASFNWTLQRDSNAGLVLEQLLQRLEYLSDGERRLRSTFETSSDDPLKIKMPLSSREIDWRDPYSVLTHFLEKNRRRRLQVQNVEGEPVRRSPNLYGLLDNAYDELEDLLKSPLKVPRFDEYVELSMNLNRILDPSNNLPKVFAESSYGRQWGNLLTLGTLHLAPVSSRRANDFWTYLNLTYGSVLDDGRQNNDTESLLLKVRMHETEDDALDYIDETHRSERTWALLDFTSWSDDIDVLDQSYKIRMNYTTIPNTARITDFVAIGLDTDYQQYYLSGFLTLQRTLNEFAFASSSETNCSSLVNNSVTGDLYSMPMPTAAYSQNTFYLAVGYLLGLTIAMAFLYPTSRLIACIVEEKETRMREILFIAGVKPAAHWWSWLLTALGVFFVISVLVTWTLSSSVLKYSAPPYLFAWIGLFSTASIGFCLTIASLFHQSKLAAIIGPMALFATILPRFIFFGYNRYEATTAKKWASLLPATAFAFGADIVADYEYAEQGVQSWNVGEGDYSFNTSLAFLFFDTFLYTFLGWYLDQVLPRQYGKARPFYFLFSPRYWLPWFFRGTPKRRAGEPMQDPQDSPSALQLEASDMLHQNHERVTDPSLCPCVEIRNLVKCYSKKKGAIPAVNKFSFSLYQDQITALLGHNGAGKTTLVSILTGMIQPTEGDCIIDGYSIVDENLEARRSMSLCPQENILFERLTVFEHIAFFMRIKGCTRPTKAEVRSRAEEVGLAEFFYRRAAALSGGNKRKLCLAAAFCGDPKFLVLDEPTSGMDPGSRRDCWECLRKRRENHVILLVSHTMSEAEILADRVAIMKEGRLQASGGPLFLKNRFGLGYNLTVVSETKESSGCGPNRNKQLTSGEELESGVSGLDDEVPGDRLLSFLQGFVPDVLRTRVSGNEMTFRLPKGQEQKFPAMFEALELQRSAMGVGAFGVENASLEEVFLLLADEQSEAEDKPEASDVGGHDNASSATHDNTSSSTVEHQYVPLSFLRQIGLLYWKRFAIQKRDLKGAFFSILVPILLVGLVLLVLTINVPIVGPAIEVSPALYKTSSTGSRDQSDVWVGGGASVLEYERLDSILRDRYPHLNFRLLEDAGSSAQVSQHLLDSYNDHTHHIRFGAYALRDVINGTFVFDRKYTQELIGDFSRSNFQFDFFGGSDNDDGQRGIPLDLLLLLLQDSNGTVNYNVTVSTEASILHNASSPHSVAAFNQAYFQYLFHSCGEGKLVSSINHPLPLTTEQSIEVKTILSILASLFILIPFCYIPGAFVVFLVKEKVCKSKHLQLVSGVRIPAYWISAYVWDASLFFVLTVLAMVVFLIYGKDAAEVFVGDAESFFCTMALTFGYGLSVLPFSYLFARQFDNHSSAQIAVIGLVFVTGFVAVNAYFIMDSIEKTQDIAQSLRPLFRMWPAYNVGEGLIQLASAFWEREILGENSRPFDWDVAGKNLVLLYTLSLPYFAVLLLLEGGFSSRFHWLIGGAWEKLVLRCYGLSKEDGTHSQNERFGERQYIRDDDVEQERLLIAEHTADVKRDAPVLYLDLWKIYLPPNSGFFGILLSPIRWAFNIVCCRWGRICPCADDSVTSNEEEKQSNAPKVAVRGLTTAIRKEEIFAFLGPNGSGKTTSIGMLTGDVTPTYGSAFVCGHDVSGADPRGVEQARKKIGLCPQINPLLDLMTGRETLAMYARIRGIPLRHINDEVQNLLDRLTLTPHADKITETYSGGNKRKLSLGISLVSSPAVLLIDESSSGIDPSASRKIWDLISDVSQGRSVLLTTHSMDEAQALSTKTGIMASGQLLCLGSVQHLKTKYLDGYTIDIFLEPSDDESPEAISEEDACVTQDMIENSLPAATLAERHGRFFRFDVSSVSAFGLGRIFQRLEELKNEETTPYRIENYSIKQCSLEQVFIKLVKNSDRRDVPHTSADASAADVPAEP